MKHFVSNLFSTLWRNYRGLFLRLWSTSKAAALIVCGLVPVTLCLVLANTVTGGNRPSATPTGIPATAIARVISTAAPTLAPVERTSTVVPILAPTVDVRSTVLTATINPATPLQADTKTVVPIPMVTVSPNSNSKLISAKTLFSFLSNNGYKLSSPKAFGDGYIVFVETEDEPDEDISFVYIDDTLVNASIETMVLFKDEKNLIQIASIKMQRFLEAVVPNWTIGNKWLNSETEQLVEIVRKQTRVEKEFLDGDLSADFTVSFLDKTYRKAELTIYSVSGLARINLKQAGVTAIATAKPIQTAVNIPKLSATATPLYGLCEVHSTLNFSVKWQ